MWHVAKLELEMVGLRWFTEPPNPSKDRAGPPILRSKLHRSILTAFALGYEQIVSAVDCGYDLTTPRGLWRPKGPGESWRVSRKALVLDVSPPISERSIWQAIVLMRQSPASNISK